jgi:hypothetical protein
MPAPITEIGSVGSLMVLLRMYVPAGKKKAVPFAEWAARAA